MGFGAGMKKGHIMETFTSSKGTGRGSKVTQLPGAQPTIRNVFISLKEKPKLDSGLVCDIHEGHMIYNVDRELFLVHEDGVIEWRQISRLMMKDEWIDDVMEGVKPLASEIWQQFKGHTVVFVPCVMYHMEVLLETTREIKIYHDLDFKYAVTYPWGKSHECAGDN